MEKVFSKKASNLDISNQGVKVYDGHKSDFKFSEDALKEVPTSRVPTKEEIEAYRQKAITETKTQQLAQTQLDIDIGKNIGAILQTDQAEADLKVAEAKAEERRAEERAVKVEGKRVKANKK